MAGPTTWLLIRQGNSAPCVRIVLKCVVDYLGETSERKSYAAAEAPASRCRAPGDIALIWGNLT